MAFRSASILPVCGAVLAALLAACSEDGVTPPPPIPVPVWSEIDDIPPEPSLYALWAPSADSVLAVGAGGDVWRWDGQRWSEVASDTQRDLYSIAGRPSGPVVAVGTNGTAVRLAGDSFVRTITPTLEDLQGVWMATPDSFLVVGGRGVVLHGDGTDWTLESTPGDRTLLSVWGTGPSDVFAVGLDGVVLHRDGVEWSEMQSGTTEILSAVSGAAGDDVYAVGAAGTILHYDGVSWSPMTSGTTALLHSVWARDGEPVVAGANGTVLQWSAGVWTSQSLATGEWLYGAARAGGRLWVVGTHAIFSHDGVAWSRPTRGSVPILRGATNSASAGIVAVGNGGYVALGHPGDWRAEDAGVVRSLNAVWISPDGDILGAGSNRILRRTGAGWVDENAEIIDYADIGGTGSVVLAVGTQAAIRRRVGTAWTSVLITSPTDIVDDLHAIAMSSNDGFIAGENGLVLRYDGATWRPMATRTRIDLWDIVPVTATSRRAIAVGDGGLILALSTSAVGWTPMASPTNSALYALARGPDRTLYAVGANGKVIFLAGDAWGTLPAPTTRPLLHAWSRGNALFVCGGDPIDGGVLLRFGL